jgi:hypothetical protein
MVNRAGQNAHPRAYVSGSGPEVRVNEGGQRSPWSLFGYRFICCPDGGCLTFSVTRARLRIGGRLLSRILRGANYFLDFCRLREALTALVMISPSVLPKA